MLKHFFGIFRIQAEESLAALIALMAFTALNAMNVVRYWDTLSVVGQGYGDFIREWHVSGFDPITYSVLTDWTIGYNIYRHPLLPYFVWPFSKLNEGLMLLTDTNWALVITAFILIFCAFYSFIFLSRIFREIIGTKRSEAYILTTLAFSFAYIMLATMVPDHFGPSMFCLILTLYLAGLKLQRGRALNWWQTIVMFFFTAGISLNNGLKTFLAALMTRRKGFFKPGYFIIAVLLPAGLMWWGARLSYSHFVWPEWKARQDRTAKAFNERIEKNYSKVWEEEEAQWKNAAPAKAEARRRAIRDSIRKDLLVKKSRRWRKSAAYRHTGKPMAEGEFSRWTDMTTSRTDVAVECLFGEGIMLHEEHLLGDVLVNRPVIVHYRNRGNYIVEALLVLLFLAGIRAGRKSLFLWTCLSFFFMDMLLHMVLGFGINEIYIMSAHYLFVMPIAMGYLLTASSARWRKNLRLTLSAVACYLIIWNVWLIAEYLYIL